MKKIILASLFVLTLFTPMVLAAPSDYTPASESISQLSTDFSESINCSGRCESCSDQSCQRRRRPYQGENN